MGKRSFSSQKGTNVNEVFVASKLVEKCLRGGASLVRNGCQFAKFLDGRSRSAIALFVFTVFLFAAVFH